MLQKYFDNIYVINLDKREDRWEHVQSELGKYDIEAERVSAVNGFKHPKRKEVNVNPGALGCSLSHIGVLEDAKENRYDSILVFEDDIVFERNFDRRFEDYYSQLPDDWKMLYLGGNHRKKPEKYSRNVSIVKKTLTTHSYALKSEIYNYVLDKINGKHYDLPVDNIYTHIQREKTVYTFNPRIVVQLEGYSDILGGFRNYDKVLKDL